MIKLCDVCKEEIEPQLDQHGNIAWDKGHNPWPLTKDNFGYDLPKDARCCDECNSDVLIARMLDMKRLEKEGAV